MEKYINIFEGKHLLAIPQRALIPRNKLNKYKTCKWMKI